MLRTNRGFKIKFSSSIRRNFSSVNEKFDISNLEIIKTQKPNKLPDQLETLQFGKTYSDHMLEVDWTTDKGWSKPIISPIHNLSLHPGCSVFQYAIEVRTIFVLFFHQSS